MTSDLGFETVSLPPYKVILCGMKGVGKTTLLDMLQRNVDRDFVQTNTRRVTGSGVSSRGRTKVNLEIVCNEKKVPVQVWDTGNMEVHSGSIGITRSYFRDTHGAILIYERGDEESKQELRQWIESTVNESPECILSIWCNNKSETFGGSSNMTRNIMDDIIGYFKIDPDLVFTYTSGRDVETVHDHFNVLICKIIASGISTIIRRDSIALTQQSNQQEKTRKCCIKN